MEERERGKREEGERRERGGREEERVIFEADFCAGQIFPHTVSGMVSSYGSVCNTPPIHTMAGLRAAAGAQQRLSQPRVDGGPAREVSLFL